MNNWQTLPEHCFEPQQIMLQLDSVKLEALGKQWSKSDEGLSLSEFVWLMQCTIPHEPQQKSQLYDGLIRLFTDIDINGDKSLEWSEFTQYITDAVITQKKFNMIDDDEATNNRYEDENEPDAIKIEKAFSKSVKSYVLQALTATKWPENTDTVVKVLPIRNDSRYFVLFRNDSKVCLFESKEFACVQQVKSPPQHQLNGSMFLDFDISEKEQILAVVNSDRKIFFWAFSNYKVPLLVGEIDVLMKSIYRLESLGLWATVASSPAIVRLWRFQSGKLTEGNMTISHTQEVTALFYVGFISRRLLH